MMKFACKMLWAQRRNYCTIFAEQVLITVALMIAAVALAVAMEKLLRPGQLDVSNVYEMYIRYAPIDNSQSNAGKHIWEGQEGVRLLLEKMKEKPYVTGVNQTQSLLPYIQKGDELASDTLRIAGGKYKVKIEPGTQSGSVVRLKGKGLPSVNGGGTGGG